MCGCLTTSQEPSSSGSVYGLPLPTSTQKSRPSTVTRSAMWSGMSSASGFVMQQSACLCVVPATKATSNPNDLRSSHMNGFSTKQRPPRPSVTSAMMRLGDGLLLIERRNETFWKGAFARTLLIKPRSSSKPGTAVCPSTSWNSKTTALGRCTASRSSLRVSIGWGSSIVCPMSSFFSSRYLRLCLEGHAGIATRRDLGNRRSTASSLSGLLV
mmetsp:Transcript_75566/g.213779  ORF Transcript_75566/g.213779 Transcript_75566/m.213779 type:complete len:213 (-) Transcript_75566:1268-1906(-)